MLNEIRKGLTERIYNEIKEGDDLSFITERLSGEGYSDDEIIKALLASMSIIRSAEESQQKGE